MGEREERIARNEVLFREVNERVKDITDSLADQSLGSLELFCECGRSDCMERLIVPPGEYEDVRARPERFIVAVGHAFSDVEKIVSQCDSYAVVEKHEEEAQLARDLDPRT